MLAAWSHRWARWLAGLHSSPLLSPKKCGGGTALAVLHARLPRTVAPDVTQHPHAGILPASLAGAAVRVQVSDRFDER